MVEWGEVQYLVLHSEKQRRTPDELLQTARVPTAPSLHAQQFSGPGCG